MHQDLQREISYIKGMLSGSTHKENLEHKAISRLIEVLDGCIEEQQDMRLRLTELEEYVETIDEDLDRVEQLIYEEEDELYSVVCSECGEEVLMEEDDLENDQVEFLCPNCHHTILDVEEDVREKELVETT